MKKLFLVSILTLTLGASGVFAEDSESVISGFNVAHVSSEDVDPAKRPFTITSIQQSGENLILWISALNIGEVSRLLNAGRLETQSTLGEEVSSPPLSLWKQVTCIDDSGATWTTNLRFSAAANCSVKATRHYLSTPVVVSNERNFGIGLAPEYLWLIEKM